MRRNAVRRALVWNVFPRVALPAAFAAVCAAVPAVSLAPAPLCAQQPEPPAAGTGRIVGIVVDASTNQPIEGVIVRLLTLERPPQLTDRFGRFQFADLVRGVHEIEIQHLAYGRGTQLINVPDGERVDFRAALRPSAIVLDSLVITTAARVSRLHKVGFIERQRRGWGYFFRDEMAAGWRIEEIVRRAPRFDIVQGADGSLSSRRVVVRDARGWCTPSIWLDGFEQRWAEGDIAQVVGALDIEGIEIYRGLDTPPQFFSNLNLRPCGAIVIWTRR